MTRLAPGESRLVRIDALLCRCARCDYEWSVMAREIAAAPIQPDRCASCRSPYWLHPRGTLRRGAPRKPAA